MDLAITDGLARTRLACVTPARAGGPRGRSFDVN